MSFSFGFVYESARSILREQSSCISRRHASKDVAKTLIFERKFGCINKALPIINATNPEPFVRYERLEAMAKSKTAVSMPLQSAS